MATLFLLFPSLCIYLITSIPFFSPSTTLYFIVEFVLFFFVNSQSANSMLYLPNI